MKQIKLKGDALNRGSYALSLYNIIKDYNQQVSTGNTVIRHTNTDNDAFVMAISAPWGFGKTYFINLFEKVLKKDSSFIEMGIDYFNDVYGYKPDNVIRYDAWKNDFWQNAFEPFLDCITSSNMFKAQSDEDVKKAGKALAYWGTAVTSVFRAVASTNSTAKILADVFTEVGKVNGDLSKLVDEPENAEKFQEYVRFRNALKELKASLENIVNKVGKIVIIIDELDRCRPTFAVQTLEIVKHLFNIKGITFIFSLDIIQLQHCVKVIYGNEFDAVGYLERFFDYTSLMPQGSKEEMFMSIAKEFRLDTTDAEQLNVYYKIIDSFHLSIREIRAVCSNFYYLSKFELQHYPKHALQLYFYLTALKHKAPVMVMESISASSKAKEFRTKLIEEYPPAFHPCTDIALEKFIKLFKDNPVIENYTEYHYVTINGDCVGSAVYKLQNMGDKYFLVNTNNNLDIKDLNPGSASFALFINDFENMYVKGKTVLEYLFSKVEMYNSNQYLQ